MDNKNIQLCTFFSAWPDVANIRQMLMSNPVQFEMLKQRFPELASAIQRNDAGMVTTCWIEGVSLSQVTDFSRFFYF